MPSVDSALEKAVRERLPWGLLVVLLVSFVPVPEWMWLGNRGEPVLALVAPVVMVEASVRARVGADV